MLYGATPPPIRTLKSNKGSNTNNGITSRSSSIAIVATAIVIMSGLVLEPGYSEHSDYIDTASSQIRYDIESIESRVQATVLSTIHMYGSHGDGIFDDITPDTRQMGIIYPFVLDAETLETVANGAFPSLNGVISDDITLADRPTDQILLDLRHNGVTWVDYMATNPDTGTVQLKRSWLYLDDGYIFGSGYYVYEGRVKDVVNDAVNLFELKGTDAFDDITPDEPVITAALYPFVLNATDWSTVAHATIPDLVGVCCSDAIRTTSDRPFDIILEDLQRDGGTWVEYVFANPDTHTEQLKRTWLYMYGDYIFGSGYYIQDSRVQSLVEEAIHLYTSHGDEAFDIITPDPDEEIHTFVYSFVLDADTLVIQAHNGLPHAIGQVDNHLTSATKSLYQIRDELSREEGIWVAYISENPNTRTDQLTRTYLSEHDGHIFGSGYYYPDSRLQSMVDESIYMYRSGGPEIFDTISAQGFKDGITQLVRNETHAMARAFGFAGGPPQVGPVPIEALNLNIQAARSLQSNWIAAQQGDGSTTASIFSFSSTTNSEQILQVYGVLYDKYLFSGTYIVADADAQSVVDYALLIYEENKDDDAWIDIITPDDLIITDAIYPFVLNATDWSTVAHGTIPEQVGKCCSDAIRETSLRPFEDVVADIDDDGRAWVEYIFLNPDTGTEQLKRTWLVERGDYIFGAGYYISDARVQAIAYRGTLTYNALGAPAVFGALGAVPEEPNSLYMFVIDPNTGVTMAQGVDPSLIGSTSDWEAALAVKENLVSEIEKEHGDFVTYTFVNPKTGETENKRTWFTLHGGYIFGTGYYVSDDLGYTAMRMQTSGN